MKMLVALLAFISSVGIPAAGRTAGDGAGLQIRLQLLPDSTLPGIPVAFRVTLSNPMDKLATVPGRLFLRVQPAEGAPFYAQFGYVQRGTDVSWPTRSLATLSPGAVVDVEYPVDTILQGPEWFVDERLNRPGVYRLQLVAVPPEVNLYDEAMSTAVGLSSDVATLTVRTPEGEDALVWSRMQEIAGGGGWNPEMHIMKGVAGFVWREHPKSYYLHYVAPLLALPGEEAIRALTAAIAIDPSGPRVGWLTLTLAGVYSRLAQETAFVGGGDLPRALQHAARARELYDVVLRREAPGKLRDHAEKGRGMVPDAAALREWKAAGAMKR